MKRIGYDADIWLEVEKYFTKINEARIANKDLKEPLKYDMYLVSSIFRANKQRYTGIFALDFDDRIIGKTGINLEEHEWAQLLNVFSKIKAHLTKSRVNDKACKRMLNYDDTETEFLHLYRVKFYVNDELYTKSPSLEYNSLKKAETGVETYIPIIQEEKGNLGKKITHKIVPFTRLPPLPAHLMQILYYHLVKQETEKIRIENCTACEIDSPQQKDHMISGNCMDIENPFERENTIAAMKRFDVYQLTKLFEVAQKELGCIQTNGFQYAIAAKEYIFSDTILYMKNNEEKMIRSYLTDVVLEIINNTPLPKSQFPKDDYKDDDKYDLFLDNPKKFKTNSQEEKEEEEEEK